MSFPLSSDRKSGFLFPTIANTSTGGAELSVPYYWNIAPNADFTFEPTEYTRRGIDLGGDLRYLSERSAASSTGTTCPTTAASARAAAACACSMWPSCPTICA